MAEQPTMVTMDDKRGRYKTLLSRINGLVTGEQDLIANLANISSALQQTMNFFWVGFYLVKKNEMVLGPFQGSIACTRIRMGKGVCGTVWQDKKAIIVPNVDDFQGHIACSSDSKSEIVLPAFKNNEVALVLDVDSNKLDDFDHVDQQYLEEIMRIIETFL